jgi:hypothetical protein
VRRFTPEEDQQIVEMRLAYMSIEPGLFNAT